MLLSQLVPDADLEVRADVACHPVDLPLDVLLRLCRDNDPVVRIRIAYRSQPLDAEVLALLARDPHREIRLTTAERQDLPVELRQNLMNDDDEEVRAAAYR